MYEDDLSVRREYDRWLADQREAYEAEYHALEGDEGARSGQVVLGRTKGLTPGYVTRDACKGKGDDIEHIPRECSAQDLTCADWRCPSKGVCADPGSTAFSEPTVGFSKRNPTRSRWLT